MLQLFYLDVAYILHTYCKRMSQMFHLFALECFMLQVQTAGVGVHEGGQGQAMATDVWRRCRPPPAVWGGGTSRVIVVVEEAGASLPGGQEEASTVPVSKRRG
jgi:hypothetical protein